MLEKQYRENTTLAFSELLDREEGAPGSPERIDFQARARAFRIGKQIKQLRERQNLTQAQLAERIGTQKSYISKIEHGADMQLTTLIKIFEHGLQLPFHIVTGDIL
ncbi:MAG: helix-turn-helix transcriptional regulator [Bacteroidia bacterium]